MVDSSGDEKLDQDALDTVNKTAFTNSPVEDVVAKLFYNRQDFLSCSTEALGGWANSFIHLGKSIALNASNCNRLVVYLAVPARAFVAIFIALGWTLQRLENSQEEIEPVADLVSDLKYNSRVILKTNGKWIRGVYCRGAEEPGLAGHIKIMITEPGRRASGLCQYYLVSEIDQLKVSEESGRTLPKRWAGRSCVGNPFLDSLLEPQILQRLLTSFNHDCLLIGRQNALKDDLLTELQTHLSDGNFVSGQIQELLRVKELAKDGLAYQCTMQSIDEDFETNLERPRTVIFDGAHAFLRRRDEFSESHWIVILDRTEAQFNPAIETANQEYLKRQKDFSIPRLVPLPGHVEIMCYED